MIGWLRTRVRKQQIIALYFEFETVLEFYNLKARPQEYSAKLKITFLPKHILWLFKRNVSWDEMIHSIHNACLS